MALFSEDLLKILGYLSMVLLLEEIRPLRKVTGGTAAAMRPGLRHKAAAVLLLAATAACRNNQVIARHRLSPRDSVDRSAFHWYIVRMGCLRDQVRRAQGRCDTIKGRT